MTQNPDRPQPVRSGVGEYLSQVVVHAGTVYVAGQVSNDGSTSVGAQTRDVLRQIDARLADAGTDRSRLLSVTVYLVDISEFAEMNAAWIEWLDGAAPPARATVQAAVAGPQWRVEMTAVAAL
jgi:enamine deaminase RidA (YjgF/YER057c/UK114 family)